jgi:hypothetical protein
MRDSKRGRGDDVFKVIDIGSQVRALSSGPLPYRPGAVLFADGTLKAPLRGSDLTPVSPDAQWLPNELCNRLGEKGGFQSHRSGVLEQKSDRDDLRKSL